MWVIGLAILCAIGLGFLFGFFVAGAMLRDFDEGQVDYIASLQSSIDALHSDSCNKTTQLDEKDRVISQLNSEFELLESRLNAYREKALELHAIESGNFCEWKAVR